MRSTIAIRRDVLRSWLTIADYTGARLADALSVSPGRVSQLLNSDQELSARLIAGLLHVTKLPFDRLFAVREFKGSPRRKTGAKPAAVPSEPLETGQ